MRTSLHSIRPPNFLSSNLPFFLGKPRKINPPGGLGLLVQTNEVRCSQSAIREVIFPSALSGLAFLVLTCIPWIQPRSEAQEFTPQKKPFPVTSWETLRLPVKVKRDFSVEKLPNNVRQLDGKRIRLRGYILPSSVFAHDVREFILIGEVEGPSRALRLGERTLDVCVHVRINDGRATTFHFYPIAVTGTVHIRPRKLENGETILVYFFAAESVERVKSQPGHGPAISLAGC